MKYFLPVKFRGKKPVLEIKFATDLWYITAKADDSCYGVAFFVGIVTSPEKDAKALTVILLPFSFQLAWVTGKFFYKGAK